MTTIPEGTRLGRYQVRSKLGQGGMGEVYLAQDTGELERTVALKFVTPEIASDPRRMQRFIQEARTVSALNHPNILTIYEFGQSDDTRFIATEFIDGTTLREHLRGRRVKLHEVLEIAGQIAAALDAAHEAGVVHRDIKPENVMIRRRDHIVKVLDFGLAKPPENTEVEQESSDSHQPTRVLVQTEPGLIMGTVAYMSPEQSRGASVDARTDIWSLGVVLFEMVAGRVPFEGKDVHRQIIAIQEHEPPPLSTLVEGVPERLQEILQKALAKEPGERYQTVKDLLIDVRSLRRKLDVEAEIERISSPEPGARSSSGQAGTAELTATHSPADTASDAQRSKASSAEYIVSRIKNHKLGTMGVLAFLLLATVVGSWRLFRNASDAATIESIAVLPFQNMSRNVEVEYLSDGMSEALINSLSELPDLSVKARSSVFRYKGKEVEPQQVASDLSVQTVLNGRVLQRGDDLVLSLSLVDARSGNQLWGNQYKRKLAELVSLQSEIAHDVSGQLRPRLTDPQQQQLSKRGTDNPAAYQAYLKGRYHWNKGPGPGYAKSRDFFQQAIDLDPAYALAYAGLSDYYGLNIGVGASPPTRENWLRSEAAANKALALDPKLGEAYNGLAGVKLSYYRDWPAADRDFRRGLALVPKNAVLHQHYGRCLFLVGRNDEAVAEARRAVELEPLEIRSNFNLARLYFFIRRYDEAIDQFRMTLEHDPTYSAAHEWLGYTYERKGLQREAITEWNKAFSLAGKSEQATVLERTYVSSGFEAALRASANMTLEEYRKKTSNGEYVPASHYVTAYMRLGDKDQAFVWMEKAVDERNRFALEFKVNPIFDGLRSDPRFDDLVARVGLRIE